MKISLENAAALLRQGNVVAIPTETVYGLAAWLFQESAIEKIFQLKNRPASNPLILHVKDRQECASFGAFLPADFEKLTAAFWPGPLTLILPICEEKIPSIARAGLTTAAFRMPKHPLAIELLNHVSPLVAPSANLSGTPSSTKPEHIENDFGIDFPLIEGFCEYGLESTILAQKNGYWEIARQGAISQEEIAKVLGYTPENNVQCKEKSRKEKPICPGQLFSHYAPKAELILSTDPYEECKKRLPIVVGFSDKKYAGAEKIFTLGSTSNPEEVAFRLYALLRDLDKNGIEKAWVDIATPTLGIWTTIRERLFRAAGQN